MRILIWKKNWNTYLVMLSKYGIFGFKCIRSFRNTKYPVLQSLHCLIWNTIIEWPDKYLTTKSLCIYTRSTLIYLFSLFPIPSLTFPISERSNIKISLF